MTEWPETFPPSCPPEDAVTPPNGDFYRFVGAESITESDFYNHHELLALGRVRSRFWDDDCKAAGLSLYRELEESKKQRQAVGPLRKKLIARGKIAGSGLSKHTPSERTPSHHTWWRPVGDEAWKTFSVVAS
ncbi:hypothetical protein [Amycolatopsis sp. NPDC001319]|uniref:hypothetical protein n=1 Tax=unclassified Amycolatopsis TaxID=2618356 RepID=UPI0036B78A00